MTQPGSIVPLSEMNEHKDDHLAWFVNLHQYAPLDRLALDTQRLKNLARIGGVANLAIYSGYGDITTEDVSLSGMHGHGTLSATGIQSRVVDYQPTGTGKAFINGSDKDSQASDFVWSNGLVKINTSELNHRANRLLNDQVLIRSPQLWANLLNEAINEGLYDTARASLTGSGVSSLSRAIFRRSMIIEIAGSYFMESVNKNLTETISFAGSVMSLFQIASLMVGMTQGNYFKDFKWSIVPGVHYDRLFLAKVIPKLYPVIQIIE